MLRRHFNLISVKRWIYRGNSSSPSFWGGTEFGTAMLTPSSICPSHLFASRPSRHAAIREPRAVGELRKILETSNDVDWNSAAMRSLGRLGAIELAPQFLEIARNAKNPLAPSALIALGDLHEVKALEIARAGFASRDTEIVTASARAAGNLLALATVKADDVHDQLAS